MSRFLQLHLLTVYGAANLNRDDTGRPKTLNFGGAERLRISSQSLKRAFRTSDVFADHLPGALGQRSQGFMEGLINTLVDGGLSPDDALLRAEAVVENDHLGKVKDKGKGRAKTEQLVHLGPEEQAAIAELAERLLASPELDSKTALVLRHKPRAADIAMFGRMLADNSGFNVEAAVQVAHAITTHRVVVEDDYYTAVDDIKSADQDQDRGAGFIGVQQFGAGTFYLYICVDTALLLDNLGGERSLAADTLEALVEAAATVSPGGKQNAFASRAKALHIRMETGDDAPRTLAAAFQHPVGARPGEADTKAASVQRLTALADGYKSAYDEDFTVHVMDVEQPDSLGLADLVQAARAIYAAG